MSKGLKLAAALSSVLALSVPSVSCENETNNKKLDKISQAEDKLDEIGEISETNHKRTLKLIDEVVELKKENQRLRKKLLRCNRDFTNSGVRCAKTISRLVVDKYK
ncbi:MAG: hypothetical protein ABID64_00925 [Nitrospirota bacterium]